MSNLTLPGLIDVHVHLRDMGQNHKEDFHTGTAAALAGGFTTVLDMPNKVEPITTLARLDNEREEARKKTVCDIGFHFGSLGENLEEFAKVQDKVTGLKLYLNLTTGGFIINGEVMKQIYEAWSQVSTKPVLLHSEEDTVSMVTEVIKVTGQRSHFCHVSSAHELRQIIAAKEEGLPVTCGVCPHHLFLTEDDVADLGPYGRMKPPLKTQADLEYLWANMKYVDVIESDHAPHTKEEKESDNPPFGVTGLETTLPLLLTAEKEGRITVEEIIRLCYTNPAKIFNLETNPDTRIEVNLDEYELKNEDLKTKCGWSPFAGWKLRGKVEQVFIRGEKVYENGKVLVNAGNGRVI
jgi:dihydroorotase